MLNVINKSHFGSEKLGIYFFIFIQIAVFYF